MNDDEYAHPSKRAQPFFYGYVVVIAATVIMVASYGAFYSFGIFFKPILEDFHWTRAMTSGAFSLATILSGVTSVLVGRLTDRFGSQMVMTLVGLLLGLGYLLMSQISSIWQLYLFYGVLIGLGMGGPFVSLLTTIARWFVARRGLMTGIVLAGIGVGSIIVPPVANWLISNFNWHTSYVILGIMVLALIVPSAQFFRAKPKPTGQITYGEDERVEHQSQVETRAISLREAIGTWQLWTVCTMVFCLGFCVFSIIVHIVPHATDLGISPSIASLLLAIIGISSIGGKVGMGYLADSIGARKVWIICFAFLAIAMIGTAITTEVWILYAVIAVFGFAYGGGVSVESILIAELFGLDSLGAILGLAGFFFTFGAALGPLQAGYIFDVTSSYQLAFIILGIAAVLGLIASAAIKPINHNRISSQVNTH